MSPAAKAAHLIVLYLDVRVDSDTNGIDRRFRVEAGHHAFPVNFDRPGTNAKVPGDLLIGIALEHPDQDLPLSRRQPGDSAPCLQDSSVEVVRRQGVERSQRVADSVFGVLAKHLALGQDSKKFTLSHRPPSDKARRFGSRLNSAWRRRVALQSQKPRGAEAEHLVAGHDQMIDQRQVQLGGEVTDPLGGRDIGRARLGEARGMIVCQDQRPRTEVE